MDKSLVSCFLTHSVYVRSVEYSTLMSILDEFRFSFVFMGCQKSALIAIIKTLADKKGTVFPYSLPSVGPGADPGVQAVSPQVT